MRYLDIKHQDHEVSDSSMAIQKQQLSSVKSYKVIMHFKSSVKWSKLHNKLFNLICVKWHKTDTIETRYRIRYSCNGMISSNDVTG